jgi:hypothetical protein
MPSVANSLLAGSHFYLSFAVFVSILFHWIDLYNLSIKTLQHSYSFANQTPITVEDMIEQVSFLRRLKLPFFVTVTLMAVFQWVTVYVPNLFPFFLAYCCVNYMLLSVGYLLYPFPA